MWDHITNHLVHSPQLQGSKLGLRGQKWLGKDKGLVKGRFQNRHPGLSNLQLTAKKIIFNLRYCAMKYKNYGMDHSRIASGMLSPCVLLFFLWLAFSLRVNLDPERAFLAAANDRVLSILRDRGGDKENRSAMRIPRAWKCDPLLLGAPPPRKSRARGTRIQLPSRGLQDLPPLPPAHEEDAFWFAAVPRLRDPNHRARGLPGTEGSSPLPRAEEPAPLPRRNRARSPPPQSGSPGRRGARAADRGGHVGSAAALRQAPAPRLGPTSRLPPRPLPVGRGILPPSTLHQSEGICGR